jgi:hypothetical protein
MRVHILQMKLENIQYSLRWCIDSRNMNLLTIQIDAEHKKNIKLSRYKFSTFKKYFTHKNHKYLMIINA